jgi:hypothetical protein
MFFVSPRQTISTFQPQAGKKTTDARTSSSVRYGAIFASEKANVSILLMCREETALVTIMQRSP